jgi:hypothetical protein
MANLSAVAYRLPLGVDPGPEAQEAMRAILPDPSVSGRLPPAPDPLPEWDSRLPERALVPTTTGPEWIAALLEALPLEVSVQRSRTLSKLCA